MNPNSSESGPQFELPKPPEGLEKQREQAMEKQVPQESKQARRAPTASQPATLAPIPAPGPVAIPVEDVQTIQKGQAIDDTGLKADEADLIEKQWVNKAKAIVVQTQDDPYNQKKEMGKVGAEYIKKRFNKTIPTDDAVSG
jgi:hypothetical protein